MNLKNKEYKCICGKIFKNSQSLNGHKSNCKDWYLFKNGNLDNYIDLNKRRSFAAQITLKEKYKQQNEQRLCEWIEEQHICEHCGKIMTNYYGSGRFCSRQCANSHIQTVQINTKRSLTLLSKYNPELTINELINKSEILHQEKVIAAQNKLSKKETINLPQIEKEKLPSGYPSRKHTPYSEQFWKLVLDNYDIRYTQNVPVWKPGPNNYWLDFLIEDKIDLEIDGSFHNEPNIKQKDIKRDEYLKNCGYIIYRIPWINPISYKNKVLVKQQIEDLLNFLITTLA